MCRVDHSTSRKPRRVTVSTAKQAIHQETTSCATTATASLEDSLRSSFNEVEERYPVTGFHSNIIDDYVVFPTVLGSGHYGTVRECIHRNTRQFYAVKSIEKAKIGRLDHLRREVNLLCKMNHSSIMRMTDCFEDEEYVHIVTDKYTGGELFDKIIEKTSDDGCFPEKKTAEIIKSLLEAVQYLHDNGIVHRDIKPENILFEHEGEDSAIKLIDFGLSREHRSGVDAMMSNPVGTAYYMSPELLKGQYDCSTDIWSVGICAYILLCGYPPFNGRTDPDIFEAIKKGKFQFHGDAWDNVSVEAKHFIKCLLKRNPLKRMTAQQCLMHPWIKQLVEHQNEEKLVACEMKSRRLIFDLLNKCK